MASGCSSLISFKSSIPFISGIKKSEITTSTRARPTWLSVRLDELERVRGRCEPFDVVIRFEREKVLDTGHHHILVVDDHREIRNSVTR